LFGWAAITYDPEKDHLRPGESRGLHDALRTVNRAPFGAGPLTLMALGLACFGIYCFAWARHPKVSTDTDKPQQI
jgi:hypothetical protein